MPSGVNTKHALLKLLRRFVTHGVWYQGLWVPKLQWCASLLRKRNIYRMSLKKGTFLISFLFLFQESDFTFSHAFWDQNFKPNSSSNSNNILSESDAAKASLHKAGLKTMYIVHACILACFGQFWFWMGIVLVARWNGLKILISKHMWKSKIRLPEQNC